jgi:hypothetical protein
MHYSKQKKNEKRTIHFSPISTRRGAELAEAQRGRGGEKEKGEGRHKERHLNISNSSFLIPHLFFLCAFASSA